MALPHHPAAPEEGAEEDHGPTQDEERGEDGDLAPRHIPEGCRLGADDESEEADTQAGQRKYEIKH